MEMLRAEVESERQRAEQLENLGAELRAARMRSAKAESNLSVERQLEDERQSALGDLEAQLKQISLDKQRLACEKADLENALEAEQEYIMHKLHKRLMQLQNDKKDLLGEKQNLKETVKKLGMSVERLSQEKVDLEQAMEMEEEAFVNKLMRQLLSVMNKYKKMEQVLDMHGIKITFNAEGEVQRRNLEESLGRRSGSINSVMRSASMNVTPSRREQKGVDNPSSRADSGGRRGNPVVGVARREDSNSSLGSAMSAISRDVSISRDSMSSLLWTRDSSALERPT